MNGEIGSDDSIRLAKSPVGGLERRLREVVSPKFFPKNGAVKGIKFIFRRRVFNLVTLIFNTGLPVTLANCTTWSACERPAKASVLLCSNRMARQTGEATLCPQETRIVKSLLIALPIASLFCPSAGPHSTGASDLLVRTHSNRFTMTRENERENERVAAVLSARAR